METLALIELLDRDGQPRQTVRVTAWPVRIGRAIDCDVVLDDPHVAPHHATLAERDGGVRVEAEPSVNGVRVGRARLAAGASSPLTPSPAQLPLLTIGATTLRVRLAGEALAAEQPLADTAYRSRRRAAALVALIAIAALWAGFTQWLTATPGQSGTEMTSLYLGAPLALGLWCGLWAIASKLFQRHFAFWPHLEAALFWLLAAMFVSVVSAQLAFAFSWPVLAKIGIVAAGAAIVTMFWRHLCIVLPQRRHTVAWVLAGLVAVGGGLDVAERAHQERPLVGGLYLGTISLPGVRLARPQPVDAFVKSAAPLEASLSHRSKKGADDAEDEDGDDD